MLFISGRKYVKRKSNCKMDWIKLLWVFVMGVIFSHETKGDGIGKNLKIISC